MPTGVQSLNSILYDTFNDNSLQQVCQMRHFSETGKEGCCAIRKAMM